MVPCYLRGGGVPKMGAYSVLEVPPASVNSGISVDSVVSVPSQPLECAELVSATCFVVLGYRAPHSAGALFELGAVVQPSPSTAWRQAKGQLVGNEGSPLGQFCRGWFPEGKKENVDPCRSPGSEDGMDQVVFLRAERVLATQFDVCSQVARYAIREGGIRLSDAQERVP